MQCMVCWAMGGECDGMRDVSGKGENHCMGVLPCGTCWDSRWDNVILRNEGEQRCCVCGWVEEVTKGRRTGKVWEHGQ